MHHIERARWVEKGRDKSSEDELGVYKWFTLLIRQQPLSCQISAFLSGINEAVDFKQL